MSRSEHARASAAWNSPLFSGDCVQHLEGEGLFMPYGWRLVSRPRAEGVGVELPAGDDGSEVLTDGTTLTVYVGDAHRDGARAMLPVRLVAIVQEAWRYARDYRRGSAT